MLKILKSISFSGASIVIAIIDSKMFPSNTTICHLLVYDIMKQYYDWWYEKSMNWKKFPLLHLKYQGIAIIGIKVVTPEI